MPKTLATIVSALLLAAATGACGKTHENSPPAATNAAPIADFPRTEPSAWINGAPLPLERARGSVVLVEAWHHLCVVCRESVPAVLALERRFKDRGLRVVGVSSIDPDDEAGEKASSDEAARKEKMDYPTYLDAGGKWSEKQGISDIPAFLVLGPDGRVVYRHRGRLSESTQAFADIASAIEQRL